MSQVYHYLILKTCLSISFLFIATSFYAQDKKMASKLDGQKNKKIVIKIKHNQITVNDLKNNISETKTIESNETINFKLNTIKFLIIKNDEKKKIKINVSDNQNDFSSNEQLYIIKLTSDSIEKESDQNLPYQNSKQIEESQEISDLLTISPNPIVGQTLRINSPLKNAKYSIFDYTGKLLQNGNFNHEIILNNLPAGTYMLKLNDDENSVTKLFTKK